MSKHLKRRRLTAAVATLATLSAGGMLAATVAANPAAAETGGPSVMITPVSASPTNATPLAFNLSFSPAISVSTFDASDVQVLGGETATVTVTRDAGAPNTCVFFLGPFTIPYQCEDQYLVELTPTSGDGTYSIQILEDRASGDVEAGAGLDFRGTQASNTASIVYDITQPTVGLVVTTPDDPTNDDPIVLKATFSEPVTGFVSADVNVTNGTATVVPVSSTVYTINVSPTADGAVTVQLPNNAAVDAAGNLSTNSVLRTVTSDQTRPDVSLVLTTPDDPTNDDPIVATATFSEPVTGFTSADVQVTNGTATVTAVSSTVYTINVSPTGDGPVTIFLPNNAAFDAVGNGSNNSVVLTVTSDQTRPTVNLVLTTPGDPTNDDPIVFTATFDEPVTGFVAADVVVTSGTLVSLTANSSTVYTISVSPTGDGPVTVRIIPGAAQDAAGNDNVGDQLTVTSDKTGPVITAPDITVDATSSAGASVTFTVTANDAIDGSVAVTCDETSGDTFGIGTTTVMCTATDSAGNSTTDTFVITVRVADTVLVANTLNVQFGKGASNSLTATLTRNDTTNPIAGQPITFRIGNGSPAQPFVTICVDNTNAAGVASCPISGQALKAARLQGQFTASFAGNVFLEAETDTGLVIT